MSELATLIERNRETLTQRFADRVYRQSAPAELAREDVINALREFLDGLVAKLRAQGSPTNANNPPLAKNEIAADHGKQRFLLGYDVGGLVRDYESLREELFILMAEHHLNPDAATMGTLTQYLVTSIADATSRYALEKDEELRKQTSRHMGFLAHELRNPLASMRLAFETLRRATAVPHNKSVAILDRGFARLSHLIDDVLIEVRLRTTDEVRLEELDIGALVAEMAQESELDAEAKDLKLVAEISDVLTVQGDPKLLRSAISNLIRNAVKFSHARGAIQVRARRADGRILVAVQDACGGLAEGQVATIFDPFVQTGRDRSGFGLGLAIAKQVADAHQGAIRVHNLPGTGCVFVLDLPEVLEPVPT